MHLNAQFIKECFVENDMPESLIFGFMMAININKVLFIILKSSIIVSSNLSLPLLAGCSWLFVLGCS